MMLELTTWEIKKILKRRSAQAALVLTVLFTLLVAGTKIIYDMSYKPDDTIGRIWGYRQIAAEYAMADAWRGPLTPEVMEAARDQYAAAFAPEYRTADGYVVTEAWEAYAHPVNLIVDFARRYLASDQAYTTFEDNLQAVLDISTEDFQAFYAARDSALEERLRYKLEDEEDIQFFLEMNAQVQTPFYYDWYRGQDSFAESFEFIANFVGIMLCIALAPVFAGEYQSGAAAVVLCTRQGRGRLGGAKLLAALLLSAADFALCAGVYLGVQFAFLGTRALECPIQLVSGTAAAPLTLGQAEAYGVLLGFAGVLAAAGLTLAFSARLHSPFPVIVAVLGILLLVPFFSGILPEIRWVQALLALIPLTKDYSLLWGYDLYHLLGCRVWAPVVVLAAQPVILLCCLPLARRLYIRHQVR